MKAIHRHKIIFAGPVSAGKTTAIACVSDTPPVATEARARDKTRHLKSHTTVAMDFGVMDLGAGEKLFLYGTPGQPRFEFMWEILAEGVLGMVLLIDDSAPDALQKMFLYLNAFGGVIEKTRFVVGVTKTDLSGRVGLDRYYHKLEHYGYKVPVLEVDARDRRQVVLLLQALLYTIDPGVAVEPSMEPLP